MGDLAEGLHINELVEANNAIKLYYSTPGFKKELVESLYTNYPVLKQVSSQKTDPARALTSQ
jgi:hypothetical protein